MIRKEAAKLREDVTAMMSDLHSKTTSMAKERRDERRRSYKLLVKETHDLLKRFKKARNEIRREHSKTRNELLKAFDIWHSSFGQRLGAAAPKISAKEKVEEQYKEIVLSKAKPTVQEELFQAISQAKSFRDKILTALKSQKEGMTLEEISKVLGISEERVDRVIRRLVKREDIKKVGERYQVASS